MHRVTIWFCSLPHPPEDTALPPALLLRSVQTIHLRHHDQLKHICWEAPVVEAIFEFAPRFAAVALRA